MINDEWQKQNAARVEQCLRRMREKGSISPEDLLDFLIPEFRDLKGKSYGYWRPPGSVDEAERNYNLNLNVLLNQGQYHCVILPLNPEPTRSDFKRKYGLSRDRGCRITLDGLKTLITEGRVRVILAYEPERFMNTPCRDLYDEIFQCCEHSDLEYRPPFAPDIFRRLMTALRSDSISLDECASTVEKALSDEGVTEISRKVARDRARVRHELISRFCLLKSFGFENASSVVLECLDIDPMLGWEVLHEHSYYLVDSYSEALLGSMNLNFSELRSSLRPVAQRLSKLSATLLKRLLVSLPVSSAVLSCELERLQAVLAQRELVKLLQRQPEELKGATMQFNRSLLRKLEIKEAIKYLVRIDQIVGECYDKELKRYAKMERVSGASVRLGGYFAQIVENSAHLMARFLEEGVDIGAPYMKLFTEIIAKEGFEVGSKLLRAKLGELNPREIVRWWANKNPFEQTGIPFILFQNFRTGFSGKKIVARPSLSEQDKAEC